MILTWRGQVGPRSGVKWSGRLAAPVGALGFLFDENTSAECLSNLYNQDACHLLCLASGITGYGALLATECQNQCMIEMCGQGVLPACHFPPTGMPCNPLATQKEMQKAGALLSPCLKACMDTYQGPEFGTDEEGLKAFARQCIKKCGLVPAVRASSSPKKGGGGGGGTTTPPATSTTAAASSGGSTGIALAIAGVVIGVAAFFLSR